MSCGPTSNNGLASVPVGLWNALSDEGFRLFFPLAAAYAALWPAMWVLAFTFNLPLAHEVPATLWHGHEMLVGAFGAALIGFLTTAAPEWTDSKPLKGRILWTLAGLWATGRLVGVFGWDDLTVIGAMADLSWMTLLLTYLLVLSWRRRTDRLLAFTFWLTILLGSVAVIRIAFVVGYLEVAAQALQVAGLTYMGMLGLAVGRITVPVTNLVLDPTEATSPFRPHPGRLNLASGLILVAILGEIAGLSLAVSGFLMIAAGAAFMDRVAEAFIGKAAFQSEILMLAGSSAFTGLGLILTGSARLGAPWSEMSGLHLAFLGGLGLGVYAVFCIAGKLHIGRPLGQSIMVRCGAVCLCFAAVTRIAPDFGIPLPGSIYGLSVVLWAAAFLFWLTDFWPRLRTIE
ncbi:MAG: NnrS family protein [Roseibium sp.]